MVDGILISGMYSIEGDHLRSEARMGVEPVLQTPLQPKRPRTSECGHSGALPTHGFLKDTLLTHNSLCFYG